MSFLRRHIWYNQPSHKSGSYQYLYMSVIFNYFDESKRKLGFGTKGQFYEVCNCKTGLNFDVNRGFLVSFINHYW